MFHHPAAIVLALLPMAWASSDSAAHGRSAGAARRAAEEDLARYFPAGWQRESLPDWPVAAAPVLRNVQSKWRISALAAVFRGSVRAVRRALHPLGRQLNARRGSSRG
jgi:hypothetical protein